MPRQRRSATSRGGATVIAIGLIALTVAAVGLSVAALRQGRGPGDLDATVGPAPTFTYAVRTPTATPTASASPTPASAAAPGAAERFLSVGADAMWRATAGTCGGAAPVVERSGDSGATWQAVTPTTKGAAQILSLTSFGGRNATAVTALGTSCTLNTLRTYTDGQFWEPYPDIFAADTYVLPGERAVIVDGTRIAAPCASPWGLRSAGSTTALVCDGTAYRLEGQNWTRLAAGARAVAVAARTVYIAETDAACTGIRITARSSDATDATDLGCTALDAADAAGPLALDASSSSSGTVLTLWAGSRLIDVAG
ncbi:hypothetical protein DEU37_1156 [Microbacterium sp. AG790]|uniref:hypothetical protein n=1 Tax=Microbacterium sp. AG790 TaxID=2183995 RepID=UPI000EB40604|nr:hypothetical protein [Microbacterium sp. AG790]RKS89841.1 hypothetical protein DEU37_1156 [Microbacterium sp. AG790]